MTEAESTDRGANWPTAKPNAGFSILSARERMSVVAATSTAVMEESEEERKATSTAVMTWSTSSLGHTHMAVLCHLQPRGGDGALPADDRIRQNQSDRNNPTGWVGGWVGGSDRINPTEIRTADRSIGPTDPI